MPQLADEIIADRKKHPSDKKDVLNAMLLNKDPETGKPLASKLHICSYD